MRAVRKRVIDGIMAESLFRLACNMEERRLVWWRRSVICEVDGFWIFRRASINFESYSIAAYNIRHKYQHPRKHIKIKKLLYKYMSSGEP